MNDIPATLQSAIPEELLNVAADWWIGLPDADREELTRLCDARREIFLFETISGAEGNPRVTGGKFLPHDDAFGLGEWGEDYFDYLLGHPELMIVFDPTTRAFHIGCSRHIAARRCFVRGIVSQAFDCPFGDSDCRMQAILGPRTTALLRPLAR